MPQESSDGRFSEERSSEQGASTDELMTELYTELRNLASAFFREQQQGHTLQPTALVNEAYLRLSKRSDVQFEGRTHFFNVAARAMRQVLTDHRRGKIAAKRGGGMKRITLSEVGSEPLTHLVDVEPLMDQLDELSRLNERHAEVVTLRYFGGLTVGEVADALDVSKRTVESDWQMARAWLLSRLAS